MTIAAGAGLNGLYVQHYGWLNWVASTDISKAARTCTTGKALRMEALEHEIVKVS